MKKLNTILLIDDDEGDNFYHRLILEESAISHSIETSYYAEEALEYLRNNDHVPAIDLIFLDINMPRMNGFEFIDEYAKLDGKHKAKIVIVMLSTSLNPSDQARAESNPYIAGFLYKPLSEEKLQEVLATHFPNS
jgi:CheY-like chemotaxis protein